MPCAVRECASKKTRVALERDPQKRAAFVEQLHQIAPEMLIFVDECSLKWNQTRLYGWAWKGERCVCHIAARRGHNHSLVGAYSLPSPANPTGLWDLWHKPGAWNSLLFEAFIEEAVLPLAAAGSVFVWDNARIHLSRELEQKIAAKGCSVLLLPPYSPDFNPIELVWSWLKNRVRRLGPGDDEQTWLNVTQAQSQLPPQHAAPWFSHCGVCLPD